MNEQIELLAQEVVYTPPQKQRTEWIMWMDPLALLASVVIGTILYFLGDTFAYLGMFAYGLYIIKKDQQFISQFLTFFVAIVLVLWAVHRYDLSKTMELFLYPILPFLFIMLLRYGSIYTTQVSNWMEGKFQSMLNRLYLHWFPAALIVGSLVALLLKDSFNSFGAIIVLYLWKIYIWPQHHKGNVIIAIVYVVLLHLFYWQGMYTIGDPFLFVQMYAKTMLLPILIMFSK